MFDRIVAHVSAHSHDFIIGGILVAAAVWLEWTAMEPFWRFVFKRR